MRQHSAGQGPLKIREDNYVKKICQMILKDVMKHLNCKSVYLSACQSTNLGFMEILTQALFIAK